MQRRSEIEEHLVAVAEVCRRYGVRELMLFGSAARDELRPGSDVDLLVEFHPQARVGFLALAGLEQELSRALGRRVDLVPKQGLKPSIREQVLTEASVLYAA